jgi:hypothetical protein
MGIAVNEADSGTAILRIVTLDGGDCMQVGPFTNGTTADGTAEPAVPFIDLTTSGIAFNEEAFRAAVAAATADIATLTLDFGGSNSLSLGNSDEYVLSAINNGPASAPNSVARLLIGGGGLGDAGTSWACVYGGGASGPATVTTAALFSGFVLTAFPKDGTVTITGDLEATGVGVNTHTFRVTPPGGVSFVAGSNERQLTVTVAP